MTVRFLRVIGVRAHQPAAVLAVADEHPVRWNKYGWSCPCEQWQTGTEDDTCPHVEAVAELLDPRVTGEDEQ